MTNPLTTSSDIKQKLEVISSPSTSVEKKRSDIEFLLNLCFKSEDFPVSIKENKGVLVLTTLFKNEKDLKLKARITTLLLLLSLSGENRDNDGSTLNLMNDINVLSLVNLFSEKEFNVLMQAFSGLQLLGGEQTSSSSDLNTGSSISLSLSASSRFLTNVAALIDPASKLLADLQKIELLGNFTQFVLSGVMTQAADEAAKDTSTAVSKTFVAAYEKFVKTLENAHKGNFSAFDMVVAQVLQLIKDNRFIGGMSTGLNEYLNIINKWIGRWIGRFKKYNLLYKALNDGFSPSAFHGKCDNKGPTVTIIKSTEGYVFGGYTPVSWNAGISNYSEDASLQSFLFSIKNPRNAPPAKFSLTNKASAIYNDSRYGPTFGHSFSIACYQNTNSDSTGNNYTNLNGSYYANPTGVDAHTVFTGQYNFKAKDIEVYQVQ